MLVGKSVQGAVNTPNTIARASKGKNARSMSTNVTSGFHALEPGSLAVEPIYEEEKKEDDLGENEPSFVTACDTHYNGNEKGNTGRVMSFA